MPDHGGSQPKVALVIFETEYAIRRVGIETFFLKEVCHSLRPQADPSPLVADHVDQEPTPGSIGNPQDRGLELWAAVATQ